MALKSPISLTNRELVVVLETTILQRDEAKKKPGRENELLVDMCNGAIDQLKAELKRRGLEVN